MHVYYYANLWTLTAAIVVIASLMIGLPMQQSYARTVGTGVNDETRSKVPIATSDDNAYVAWWSNKTGNDEVMFKASTDGGKTWSNKINLSNTPHSDSQDVQIAADGNNVYVTWWERNQTMNEPVLRVSNDNGKTFGEKITLSEK
ncbi:MAG TPA: sialidase family protein [Nitrososphaeraceae archaeon]|nr:sialidase family protein [Nitrososphaeraceae archaeon]